MCQIFKSPKPPYDSNCEAEHVPERRYLFRTIPIVKPNMFLTRRVYKIQRNENGTYSPIIMNFLSTTTRHKKKSRFVSLLLQNCGNCRELPISDLVKCEIPPISDFVKCEIPISAFVECEWDSLCIARV